MAFADGIYGFRLAISLRANFIVQNRIKTSSGETTENAKISL
jgi:hypothetical protein